MAEKKLTTKGCGRYCGKTGETMATSENPTTNWMVPCIECGKTFAVDRDGYCVSYEDNNYRCKICDDDPEKLRARVRRLERELVTLLRGLRSNGHD